MSEEENPYVLATCPICGVIHAEGTPHSYRYVDDVAFFDEHQLRDPLNMEPIYQPVCLAPPCRHTFSKDTIEHTIRQHGCCPLDRSPQTLENVIPAPFIVQNLLDKIRVLCPNNCSDEAIPRCLLPRHLLTCPLTLLSCQRGIMRDEDTVMERCNQKIRLCDAIAHSAACEYRAFPCSKGCGKLIAAKFLSSHKCSVVKPHPKPAVPAPVPQKKRPREPSLIPFSAGKDSNMGEFQWSWGGTGSENSQFKRPTGITFSSNEKEIFVVDTHNHRVQVFSRKGEYLRKWGEMGSGNGHFNTPNNVVISSLSGEVFVCDSGNCRVQVFDQKGNYIRQWGKRGKGDGEFETCYGIAISRRQEVFVSDPLSHRIQIFSRHGEYIRQFGSEGTGDSQLNFPCGLTISNIDEIFVADTKNNCVKVFSETGAFKRKIGSAGDGPANLNNPLSVSIHGSDNKVYVTDCGNNRVQVFDVRGNIMKSLCSPGDEAESGYCFSSLNCVAVSSATGDLFVGDNNTNKIYVMVG